MIFLRDVAIKNAENLSMTNENSNFPVEFLTNDILKRQTITTNNTTTITGEYEGEYEGEVDTISILEHNLTTSATITLKLYTDTTLEATITPTVLENEIIVSFFTSQTFNNFEITITDTSLATLEIGKIILGSYVKPTINSEASFDVTILKNDVIQENETGQRYTIEGVELREFSYSFPKQSLEDSQNMRTFYKNVGKHEGFLFMNFDTDLGIDLLKPVFVFFTSDLEHNFIDNTKHTFNITMKEAK